MISFFFLFFLIDKSDIELIGDNFINQWQNDFCVISLLRAKWSILKFWLFTKPNVTPWIWQRKTKWFEYYLYSWNRLSSWKIMCPTYWNCPLPPFIYYSSSLRFSVPYDSKITYPIVCIFFLSSLCLSLSLSLVSFLSSSIGQPKINQWTEVNVFLFFPFLSLSICLYILLYVKQFISFHDHHRTK